MPSVFTTSVASRFVDREAVIDALAALARSLVEQCPGVAQVYLFGSFATAQATPRSDADVAIVVDSETSEDRKRVWRRAFEIFLEAPVPVEHFVLTSTQASQKRGVAGAVFREGLLLAADG